MLLDNLQKIKITELCGKLQNKTNNRLLCFCYDVLPETYIIYNMKPETNIKIWDFKNDFNNVDRMKYILSKNSQADICIIKNLYEDIQILFNLLEIIKLKRVNTKSLEIKNWVLFSNDIAFISACDEFISNFESYNFITDEAVGSSMSTNTINELNDIQDETILNAHMVDLEDEQEQGELEEWYAIFAEENIVTEDVFQVRFENDEYKSGIVVNINDKLNELSNTTDITSLLKSSLANAAENRSIIDIIAEQHQEKEPKNIIEAAVGLVNAADDFGHYLTRGSICPVCHKRVRFLPSNGFCSLKCAAKYLLDKIAVCLTGEYELDTETVVDKIKNIMDYFNLVFNVISKIPDLLASVATLPEEYKNYATVKINLIFLEMKKIINLLLIKKNELIVRLLSKIKFGTIDQKLENFLEPIQLVLKTAESLREKLEQSLEQAYKAITKANALFYIGPQEYGFFTTLKSQNCICPYYKTDPLTYPSDQLGRPFWGSGVMNIAFDMSMCQTSIDIGAKSALKNVDMKKINEAIRKVFKPIKTPEYLMDPDLFDVRLALSDQNSPSIQRLINYLQKTMVLGGDFLPEYKNLSLGNIWFVIAILTCWGPWTRAIYGDFLYHSWIL